MDPDKGLRGRIRLNLNKRTALKISGNVQKSFAHINPERLMPWFQAFSE